MKRAVRTFPIETELLTRQDAVLEGEPAVYVYGIAKRDSMIESAVAFVEGIVPGIPVEVFPAGHFVAIVSRAPEAAFAFWSGEDTDPAADRVLAHHRVLTNLSMFTAIAPARVGTILHDMDGIFALLAQYGRTYSHMLERIAGAQEWAIELFADIALFRKSAERLPAVASLNDELAKSSPNRLLLLRKKRQETINHEVRRNLTGRVEIVHRFISARTREAVIHPSAFGTGWNGYAPALVLDAAYLVDRQRENEFQQVMTSLTSVLEIEGFLLKLTGPWPPYSFASIGNEEVRS
jgi:hypothetical protein